MPIIPNVIGQRKSDATTYLNEAGFDDLDFQGNGELVTDVEGANGEQPGQEAPADKTVTVTCGN